MKKIFLGGFALIAVVAGVAGMAAYEAHVINVIAHIENALSVSAEELEFGTVFPQEYLTRPFSISLSTSFMEQDRVDKVDYQIVQKPKCKCMNNPSPCPLGEYAPVNYATHLCPEEYTEMLSLCPYLSKELLDDEDGLSVGSYYQGDFCEPRTGEEKAYGSLTIESDISDNWLVDLKVPPVEGYIGQDWPAGCPFVLEDSKDYGCDLWIEVTNVSKTEPLCVPTAEVCDGVDNDCDGLVDEDLGLGGECEVGLGACHTTGTYVCNPASPLAEPICSAVAGTPSTEICTGGADEDCDGTIDCGDSDCVNEQVCQPITNNVTMNLENKRTSGDWSVIVDGIYGELTYSPSGPTFDYRFRAYGLTHGGNYNLIYYPDPWASPKAVVLIGGTIIADSSGNIDTGNQSVELNRNLPTCPGDSNCGTGAKVWLVLSTSLSGNQLSWTNVSGFLWETDWVNYQDTDLSHTETISLTDIGAALQYGYYHNYAGANVSFQYTTPDTDTITGTVIATGLKPYATYQLKFDGKPTCQYGAAGDDATNEKIGYLGRWWDNTINNNTSDANYLTNSIYHGGTHCISGYLLWGYITADASGNATKVVTTDSSYHVLWSGGGVCDTNVNTFLAHLDAAHPTIWFSPADKVDGQIERGTCGGMIFASGTYKLGVSLTEESFHQGPGTWTTVMVGNIEFKIN